MDVIEITSANELPSGKQLFMFSEDEFKRYAGDGVVYKLAHRFPKSYSEFYVEPSKDAEGEK